MQVPVSGHRHRNADPKGILLTHLRHLLQDEMKHSLQQTTSFSYRESLKNNCIQGIQLYDKARRGESVSTPRRINRFVLNKNDLYISAL